MTTLPPGTPVSRDSYRHLWIALALVIPAAVLAFVRSYVDGLTFSRLTMTTLVHAHAALMVLWMLMLVVQAWLIRARRYRVHRWVGRSSLVIAPLVVLMTLLVTHQTLNRKPQITAMDARFEIYDLMQVVGFGLAWGLAMVFRRRTPIHVRFMVSTLFAMGNAILFRIILSWFAWVPGIGAEKVAELENAARVNGAILLLALLGLIAMDWRRGIRVSPFWVLTITTAIIHVGFFTFTETAWWMDCVQWFAAL